MRYYDFALSTNAEYINENAKINLRDFAYKNPVEAMNKYMQQNMINDLFFFAFREEEGIIPSAFSYNERKMSFEEAFDRVAEMLREVFAINRIKFAPTEITMFDFLDHLMEANRRELVGSMARIADSTDLWIYYYTDSKESLGMHYVFNERIIPENIQRCDHIYDKRFLDELSNIDSHVSASDHVVNPVHYIVSTRSIEAAEDMTQTLMQNLYKAGRITSRRMEIISDIEPDLYSVKNRLSTTIENNYGGVIVLDLNGRYGCDPTEYSMTARYLVNLLKKYRNHCLFVFTYNRDEPGFSYQVLPLLSKYIVPVELREGGTDRRGAVSYLKHLIGRSEYAGYAKQADEFLKMYPGDSFSQTDVLNAYEQFEPWCLNRNVLHSYDYDVNNSFMLDRDEDETSSYEKLKKMIGLDIVRKQIDAIIASDIIEKERRKRKGSDYQLQTMHMIFGGNPGTAKTTVAKLFAKIAKEKGILKSGAFVERGGMDLDGLCCVGAIKKAFLAAKGGVLFIDEAYSMRSEMAVTTLIREMEDQREDVIVILAGYNEKMQDFMKLNEGLKSRIPHWVDFPDYNVDELTEIFKFMIRERGFFVTDNAIKEARYIFEKARYVDDFGNGRYVRNLIDRAAQNQAVRLLAEKGEIGDIRKRDLFTIKKEDIVMPEEGLKEERIAGTAQKELEDLIGLSSAKKVIRKAVSHFKLNKLCMEKGLARDKASLHMVFTGNPGTAKTTVARLFAEILKDEKVLPTGVFVEAGRADLVGDHVGSTAPLVRKKFKEAQGGVLFIDEAYSLCDSYENGFGDEAINTIVQEMENHRDEVIVIFAGYPEPMRKFLDRNPGMRSRIAFQVDFDDYSVDELCEITKLMVSKKQMRITDAAMDKLRKDYEKAQNSSDYGNGRYVRKMLEEAEMNLAERVMDTGRNKITTEMIITIDECDIPLTVSKEANKIERIGFAG